MKEKDKLYTSQLISFLVHGNPQGIIKIWSIHKKNKKTLKCYHVYKGFGHTSNTIPIYNWSDIWDNARGWCVTFTRCSGRYNGILKLKGRLRKGLLSYNKNSFIAIIFVKSKMYYISGARL